MSNIIINILRSIFVIINIIPVISAKKKKIQSTYKDCCLIPNNSTLSCPDAGRIGTIPYCMKYRMVLDENRSLKTFKKCTPCLSNNPVTVNPSSLSP